MMKKNRQLEQQILQQIKELEDLYPRAKEIGNNPTHYAYSEPMAAVKIAGWFSLACALFILLGVGIFNPGINLKTFPGTIFFGVIVFSLAAYNVMMIVTTWIKPTSLSAVAHSGVWTRFWLTGRQNWRSLHSGSATPRFITRSSPGSLLSLLMNCRAAISRIGIRNSPSGSGSASRARKRNAMRSTHRAMLSCSSESWNNVACRVTKNSV